MKFRFSKRWQKYLVGTSVAAALLTGGAATQAEETVRGVVRSQTTAPRGEIDGAVLEDGTVLHWPPHLEDDFEPVAKVGDRVEAIGQNETGPAGDRHFEVARLTNSRSGAVANNTEPQRGPRRDPPAPNRRRDEGEQTIEGRVREMTTAPRGETDGAILDDGTVLHWPPHLENAFTNILGVGDRVKAVGRIETAPRGEVNFEVRSVTNVKTGATAVNDDAGPRGPRRARANSASPDARSVRGVVRQVTTAPRGEIDGAVLENGTVLHWPPHLQDRYRDVAAIGKTIAATGRTETTPAGDTVFEVDSLANDGDDATRSRREPREDRGDRLERLERQLRDIQQQLDDLRRER